MKIDKDTEEEGKKRRMNMYAKNCSGNEKISPDGLTVAQAFSTQGWYFSTQWMKYQTNLTPTYNPSPTLENNVQHC